MSKYSSKRKKIHRLSLFFITLIPIIGYGLVSFKVMSYERMFLLNLNAFLLFLVWLIHTFEKILLSQEYEINKLRDEFYQKDKRQN